MENPCRGCPIHLRGDDKSGATCMDCEARGAYVAAIGSGRKDVILPPPAGLVAARPLPPPPPPARKTYSIGPYARQPRKKRPVGRPFAVRTVMAARRVTLGFTQARLALRTGISAKTLQAIEGGRYRRTPRPSTMQALALALDIPAETLLMPPPATSRRDDP